MPFTYRDKPKLAERLRGKSGEEILNELKSDLNTQGRRMFFDPPSWSTRQTNSPFSRGFPFDDDRNRINIRSYLDEIASRYPEFADQLKESEDFVDPSFSKPGGDQKTPNPDHQYNEPSSSSQNPGEEVKEPPQTLTNFGLRNTVPLGPTANYEDDRCQRSMSAPPENRSGNNTKRFVTKCEIPIMNNPTQESVQMKPELSGRGSQEPPPPQQQQKANNAPNVRVIPIQVEGRDTPLVNTAIDTATNFGGETFAEPSFEGRLPRDFGTYQRHSPRFTRKDRAPSPNYQYAPQYQHYVPPPQHYMHPQQPQYAPQQQQHFPPEPQVYGPPRQHPQKPPAPPPPAHNQQPHHHQHHQEQHQQHAAKIPKPDETDSKPPPPPPQQQQQQQPKPEPIKKDPLEKVQAIQKEVENLMRQVEAFKGNSRTDKQYLMLDELLTRQLLQLDVIETEGKENVRQARKDTIRSIQRCISTLENKVPLPENNETTTDSNPNQEENNTTEPMNLDKTTKENTPVDNKESNKMEVDETTKSESQPPLEQPQQLQQPQEQQNKN